MTLNFVEMLDYYDVPLTLVAEDSNNQKYICSLCNWPSKENSDLQYECVTIFDSQINDYEKEKISLEKIFENRQSFIGISKDFANTIEIKGHLPQ